MKGNPHYSGGLTQSSFDSYDAYELNESNLAIAYEQRTANLIAKLALSVQASAAGIHLNPSAEAVDNEVMARLGVQ